MTDAPPTGLLRHLEACNRCDISRYRPLLVGEQRVGWIAAPVARLLADAPDAFAVTDRSVRLLPDNPEARTAAVATVAARCAERGDLPQPRGELFEVRPHWREPALFELDRGLVPHFGTRSYGVHLNGYLDDPLRLWIGRRAADKKIEPDKLDNLVAGGIGDRHRIVDTLVKESEEEASLPPDLVARARPAGFVSYRTEREGGLRDDVLFLYDLAVPDEFVPVNRDGEMASFDVWSIGAVLDRAARTDDFKFNVALVVIDFALRHGAIGPDHPEYFALATGLRRPLD